MTNTTTKIEAARRLGYMSPEAAQEAALRLARGEYQRRIVRGEAAWSGADLRGRAREYSSRYRTSRRALLARIRRAGIPVAIHKGAHGRLTLVWGSDHV